MNKLVNAIFKDLKYSREDILKKYPRRALGTTVTRLASTKNVFKEMR